MPQLEPTSHSVTDSLARRSTTVLIILAIVTIGRLPLVQSLLSHQRVDAEKISIITQHRMLGQDVLKRVLVLEQSPLDAELTSRQIVLLDTMEASLRTWADTHQTLQAQLTERPDLTSERLFGQLDTRFGAMHEACSNVLDARAQGGQVFRNTLEQSTRRLLHHHGSFIEVSNALLSTLEQDARETTLRLENVEHLLLALTLVVLLFVGWFIFRPAFREIRHHIATLEHQQSDVLRASEGLSRINEDLETALKALLVDQEEP